MARTVSKLALAALMVATLSAVSRADCPDADLRCRIAVANTGQTVNEWGCSGGAEVGVEGTEGVVTGSVTLNGECYTVETNTDNVQYTVVGTTTAGQCYDLFQGGCQPEHCGRTAGETCNENVPACTVYGQPVCGWNYSVVEGDNCYDIALNFGIGTFEDLQALNPGVDCANLQIGTNLCLSMTQGAGQTMCEGFKTSG